MAFFHSYLTYAIQFWSSASSTTLQLVRILQKQAIRITASAHYFSHTTPLANNLNIVLLDDYIKYCECIFMHEIFHDLFPKCITFSKMYY